MERNIVSSALLVICGVIVCVGAWFTANAVVAGDSQKVAAYLIGSVLGGAFYLYLFYLSLGFSIFSAEDQE